MIFALDLGVRCGWASGRTTPTSGAVLLKQRGEHPTIAGANLMAWLSIRWARERPELVVMEDHLPLGGFLNRGNSGPTVTLTHGLHFVAGSMCRRFGIPFESFHRSTICKHFIGAGRMGKRALTKAAVIQQAIVLEYMPRDCVDDDRADALAVWDLAAARYRRGGGKLHLFGEKVA